jgi:hypothetical protein
MSQQLLIRTALRRSHTSQEELMVENDVVSQDDTAAQAAAQAAAHNKLLPSPLPHAHSPPHDLALCLPSGQRTRLILCA